MKQRLLLIGGAFLCILILAVYVWCIGSTSSSGLQRVQITETDFTIASAVTRFTPGTPYRFVVTNQGHTAHEFMILPKSEEAMPGMPMGEMDTMALARVENIAPGQTKNLDYTFVDSGGTHCINA